MQISTDWALAVGGAVIAICAWCFRLEGKVNAHEQRHLQHEKHRDEMRGDLAYIRDRIDQALNRFDEN